MKYQTEAKFLSFPGTHLWGMFAAVPLRREALLSVSCHCPAQLLQGTKSSIVRWPHGAPSVGISGRSLTQTAPPLSPARPLFFPEQPTRQKLQLNSGFACTELMLFLM